MKGCARCASEKVSAAKPEPVRPRVESVAGTVSYQKDNIVSREIIRRKNGTVTAFAFDKGQGLSEHTAPYDAPLQVLEGAVEIRISGKRFRLKRGQMIIMPANRPHQLQALTRFKMMLTMIKG